MTEKKYKETNMQPAMYANYYGTLREVAFEHGYALAIHGSLLRDMDLIAVPWIEKPRSSREMIKAMGEAIGFVWCDEYIEKYAETKPHGRMAYSLSSGGGGYIDISITNTTEGEVEMREESLLQFFQYEHLPAHLREVSKHFHDLAHQIAGTTPSNPEKTTALRKLLESKDCAVRARLFKEKPAIKADIREVQEGATA